MAPIRIGFKPRACVMRVAAQRTILESPVAGFYLELKILPEAAAEQACPKLTTALRVIPKRAPGRASCTLGEPPSIMEGRPPDARSNGSNQALARLRKSS